MTGSTTEQPAVQAMWQRFCAATGADPSSLTAADAFGDSPAMADELLALVLEGTKTATAGLVSDYAPAGEPLPAPGTHWIALDGRGAPRCVLRTVEIRLGPLSSVDAAFAWDEGEGDRTRDSWLEGHRRFFVRQAERQGAAFDEERDLVVFERFELAWTDA
jgi:uncharacterized protein YhfF